MSYIANNLMKNEQVICRPTIHWLMLHFRAIGWAIMTVITVSAVYLYRKSFGDFEILVNATYLIASIFSLLIVYAIIGNLIDQFFTEYALTNKRVIKKTGLIRRDVGEISLEKIEAVTLNQTILDRILGGGNVSITGTGANAIRIMCIDEPQAFKAQISQAIQL